MLELIKKGGGIIMACLLLTTFVACDDEDDMNGGDPLPVSMPKVYITTPENKPIVSKIDWLEGANIRVIDKYGRESLNMNTDIRGRGNTTWSMMPKKPYAIKLSEKVKVLGMPEHKRWVLLANWLDRTLLRNDVALEIARRIMPWAPRGEFVELYINEEHQGNYYLCEHIKIDENRVDIDKIKGSLQGDEISGGYILEFDKHAITQNDEPNYFVTEHKKLPVAVKEPDEDVIVSHEHPAFLYIQNYVNSIEAAFEIKDYSEAYNLIDLRSYADWLLITELTLARDAGHPKSVYMYKKRNGKLYAGPLWDFDWGTFLPGFTNWTNKHTLWYPYMFADTEFVEMLKLRWPIIKQKLNGIISYIDTKAEYIRESNETNIQLWPITQNTNGDADLSFDDAVARLKAAYLERVEAIDKLVAEL